MTGVEWREAWRVDRYGSMAPEKVEIMDVSGDFVLVKGESNTVYRGNFFATKEAAFDAAIHEEERFTRSSQERLERLRQARARHCT